MRTAMQRLASDGRPRFSGSSPLARLPVYRRVEERAYGDTESQGDALDRQKGHVRARLEAPQPADGDLELDRALLLGPASRNAHFRDASSDVLQKRHGTDLGRC